MLEARDYRVINCLIIDEITKWQYALNAIESGNIKSNLLPEDLHKYSYDRLNELIPFIKFKLKELEALQTRFSALPRPIEEPLTKHAI